MSTEIDNLVNIAELEQTNHALSLQTYEFLDGGQERAVAIEDFVLGRTLELDLPYSKLDTVELEEELRLLAADLTNLSSDNEDPICATPDYRLAEVYWLMAASRLSQRSGQEISQYEIDSFQQLNSEIYGEPDPRIESAMLGQVWQRISEVNGVDFEEAIYELENGFIFTAEDGSSIEVPPLPKPSNELETILNLDQDIAEWLKDYLNSILAPARAVIQEYYHSMPGPDEEKVFSAQDIVEVFKTAKNEMRLFDIDVRLSKESATLSWSTRENAVIVGSRRVPVDSVNELVGLFAHEVFWHGGRSACGILSGNLALQSGLFTLADEGEQPSYLNFEEGMASIIQSLVTGDDYMPDFSRSMGHYMNISLANRGWTPRQIFEVMKRVRIIYGFDDSTVISESRPWSKASEETSSQVVRAFRGTPSKLALHTSDGVTLHYAKDLSYADGEIRAKSYLNYQFKSASHEERVSLMNYLLSGKFDPTNARQKQYTDKILSGRI